ncbi:MAG TPA: prolyl oligopeptidase family serine peptidase [Actinomycetota bacterium]|nr:prolyl oligopeptidase family serine peptidase [Actinomycetota bacterium]
MPETPDALEEFPRQVARTRGFSLGVPRSFTVSPDGERVVYLRTKTGDDPVSCLWVFEVSGAKERLVFDPGEEEAERDLTEAERARRERARERSSGVTAYATDEAVRQAVFSVGGRMFLADLVEGSARELSAPGSVDDPRLDPAGERIAFVVDGWLHLREIEGGVRELALPEAPDTYWGLPEFVAAEEMDRNRGHWWSPDGSKLAAAHVDEREVSIRYLSDPTDPAAEPRAVRYPEAGSNDAVVTLWVFDVESGDRVEVRWDLEAFPYLARVTWDHEPLTLLVQTRDQRTVRLLEADPASGEASILSEHSDPRWISLVEDAPARLSDGRVVDVVADPETDTYVLTVAGEPVTPPGLQVREVVSAGEGVLFRASDGDPTEIHVWWWTPGEGAVRLSEEPGVHSGAKGGEVLVRISASPNAVRSVATVVRSGEPVGTVENVSEVPVVDPRPRFLTLGDRELRAALLLPGGREPEEPLPVLMDPYGGPHGARVLKAAGAHLTSQWFADQGFAVLVVDGRGVDGRGPAWDREMYHDFTVALDDQVDALHAAAERFDFLDLGRVGMRGWSFGGELTAMALLRRPDVFLAGVVGAPVTDQYLYDTFYTERYLGKPQDEPEVYRRNSPLLDAASLTRPMLLIHGLADDNVFVANTLRFSAALFEAGKWHELVLIPNATHLTRSTAVTENILRVQLDFLQRTVIG